MALRNYNNGERDYDGSATRQGINLYDQNLINASVMGGYGVNGAGTLVDDSAYNLGRAIGTTEENGYTPQQAVDYGNIVSELASELPFLIAPAGAGATVLRNAGRARSANRMQEAIDAAEALGSRRARIAEDNAARLAELGIGVERPAPNQLIDRSRFLNRPASYEPPIDTRTSQEIYRARMADQPRARYTGPDDTTGFEGFSYEEPRQYLAQAMHWNDGSYL